MRCHLMSFLLQTVRMFKTNYRLLITGTPLQVRFESTACCPGLTTHCMLQRPIGVQQA